jgi:hypothetical protein
LASTESCVEAPNVRCSFLFHEDNSVFPNASLHSRITNVFSNIG